MHIEIVLHATVGNTQFHHRLQLLGDDSLWRVHPYSRGILIKESWERPNRRCRDDRISEADIDLHPNPGVAQHGQNLRSDTAVLLLLPDLGGHDGIRIKLQAVFRHLRGDDLPDRGCDSRRRCLSKTQQIEVFRWPIQIGCPDAKQHRSLEYEAVSEV